MITRSNIRAGITGALLLIVLGAFTACADLPTEASGERDQADRCVIIGNTIHCPPT